MPSRRSPPTRPLEGDGRDAPASDASDLRRRARTRIEDGAVTPGYGADRAAVLRLLDAALATEIVCVLRYKRHAFTVKGIHAESVEKEFTEHAAEEQEHADRVASRIVELGGTPNLSPEGLAGRSHTEYDDSTDLVSMLREDLVAERVAIEAYGEAIRSIGDGDPVTRRMLEEILAVEERHATDLAGLLATIGECEER